MYGMFYMMPLDAAFDVVLPMTFVMAFNKLSFAILFYIVLRYYGAAVPVRMVCSP